jgi:hypothetical protein
MHPPFFYVERETPKIDERLVRTYYVVHGLLNRLAHSPQPSVSPEEQGRLIDFVLQERKQPSVFCESSEAAALANHLSSAPDNTLPRA